MAKRSDSGCGTLFLVGAVIILASRCAGTDTALTNQNVVSLGDATLPSDSPISERYVTTRTLNCRATPAKTGSIVTSLSHADLVPIAATDDEWTRIETPAGECWAASKYLSVTAPEPGPDPAPTLFTPAPARLRSESRASSSFQCGRKRVCGQMDSCAEANYYLDQCGLTRLDRDSDGIPCESIC